MDESLSMNKQVEKFCNFSLARSCCEDMGNFISYVISMYGVNATTAISFVIIGCLSPLIYVFNRRRPKPEDKQKPKLLHTRSFIIREIHSGIPALHGLVEDDYKQARLNPSTLDNADKLLKEHLQQEYPNLIILQQNAAKLEMSAKEDDAVKILREALEKTNAKEKSHEAYEIEMLLVEMLIYKGGKSDLEEALKCECLKDESLKDARRPLYKAIIYKMLEKKNETEKFWHEFIAVRDPAFGRTDDEIPYEMFEYHADRLLHEICCKFEHHVGQLRNAIQEVTANKRKVYIAIALFLLFLIVYILYYIVFKT